MPHLTEQTASLRRQYRGGQQQRLSLSAPILKGAAPDRPDAPDSGCRVHLNQLNGN
ncbi:hypothetical protein [Deinococcus ruber]|uniref:hypothetical protein n=1 Tax=Deinococcus ruber TaxID=1848197 RepID=UPI00166D2E8D|nr:hypothetical protein [Deinococcus ruber]